MKALALEKIHQINALLSDSSCMHNGLMGGTLGLVYYYFHLADILQDPALQEKAETMLATIFDELNGEDSRLHGAAYSSGASGLAYVVNNLQKNDLIAFDITSEFTDLDEYLFATACTHMERGEIDYLHGAMGPFHYFSSRQQDATIGKYLNTLANGLLQRSVVSKQGQGIYFINNSLERLRGNKADFGLAHGLSGLLLLLIAAWSGLEDKTGAEAAIRAGIAFIMQFETEPDPAEEHYSLFPFTIEAGQALSLA